MRLLSVRVAFLLAGRPCCLGCGVSFDALRVGCHIAFGARRGLFRVPLGAFRAVILAEAVLWDGHGDAPSAAVRIPDLLPGCHIGLSDCRIGGEPGGDELAHHRADAALLYIRECFERGALCPRHRDR